MRRKVAPTSESCDGERRSETAIVHRDDERREKREKRRE
jgi:hypothetical protein